MQEGEPSRPAFLLRVLELPRLCPLAQAPTGRHRLVHLRGIPQQAGRRGAMTLGEQTNEQRERGVGRGQHPHVVQAQPGARLGVDVLVDDGRAAQAGVEQRVVLGAHPCHQFGPAIGVDVRPRSLPRAAEIGPLVGMLMEVPGRARGVHAKERHPHPAGGAPFVVDDAKAVGLLLVSGPPDPHRRPVPAQVHRPLHAQIVPAIPVQEPDRPRGEPIRVAHHQHDELGELWIDRDVHVEAERIDHGAHRVRLLQSRPAERPHQPAPHEPDPFVGAEVRTPDRIAAVGLEQHLGLGRPAEPGVGRGRDPRPDRLRWRFAREQEREEHGQQCRHGGGSPPGA